MFDTLDDILFDSLARLEEGAADPGSAWRNLALGTMGLDGMPQVRTVVLRRFDRQARALEVHTDSRSAKYAELRANAGAILHGWDAASRVQLRVTGRVSLHTADSVADAAWDKLPPRSRATYRVLPRPGSVLAAPHEADQSDEVAARAVFCVVRLSISGLEWLDLGQGSQRRARFTWESAHFRAMWLVP